MNNAAKRRIKSDLNYLNREPDFINRLTEEEKKECFFYRDCCQNTDINDLNGEVWYDIPNWEGYYQISNFLRFKSVRFERIIKPRLNKKHYYDVCLHKNNKPKYFVYARLICLIFNPNPLNLPEVNHKNGIRWDNRPSNLEWTNPKNNIAHSINVLGNKRNKIKICQFHLNGKFIREWDSINEAALVLGISVGNIVNVCKGDINYSNGYKWMYKKDYLQNGTAKIKMYDTHKPLLQLDTNNNIIKEWDSCICAAKELNTCVNNILSSVKGKSKTAKGYKWQFKTD